MLLHKSISGLMLRRCVHFADKRKKMQQLWRRRRRLSACCRKALPLSYKMFLRSFSCWSMLEFDVFSQEAHTALVHSNAQLLSEIKELKQNHTEEVRPAMCGGVCPRCVCCGSNTLVRTVHLYLSHCYDLGGTVQAQFRRDNCRAKPMPCAKPTTMR